jgi:hypothetical protein
MSSFTLNKQSKLKLYKGNVYIDFILKNLSKGKINICNVGKYKKNIVGNKRKHPPKKNNQSKVRDGMLVVIAATRTMGNPREAMENHGLEGLDMAPTED